MLRMGQTVEGWRRYDGFAGCMIGGMDKVDLGVGVSVVGM